MGLIDGGYGGRTAAGLRCRGELDGTGEDRAGFVRVAGGGSGAGYCEARCGGSFGGECHGWYWGPDSCCACGDWRFVAWCLLGGDGIEEETVEGDALLDARLP